MNTDLITGNISFYNLHETAAYDSLIKYIEDEMKINAKDIEHCASEINDLCLEFPEHKEDEENPIEALKLVNDRRLLDSFTCFELDAETLTGSLYKVFQQTQKNESNVAENILFTCEQEGIFFPKPGQDISDSRLNFVDDSGDRATQDYWNFCTSKLKRSLLNQCNSESLALASSFSGPQTLWTSYSVIRSQYLQSLFRTPTNSTTFKEFVDMVVDKLEIYSDCAISDIKSVAAGSLSPMPNDLRMLYEDVLIDLCRTISGLLQPSECNGRLSSTPDSVRKSRSENATFRRTPLSKMRQQSSSVENICASYVLSIGQLQDLCRFLEAASTSINKIDEISYCLLTSPPRSKTKSVKSALKPVGSNRQEILEQKKIWVSYLDKHSQSVIATLKTFLKENVQNLHFCEEFHINTFHRPRIIDKTVYEFWNNIKKISILSKESSILVQTEFNDCFTNSLKSLIKQFFNVMDTISAGEKSAEDLFHVLASVIFSSKQASILKAKLNFNSILNTVMEQIINTQMHIISSYILLDSDSQFWSSKQVFYEDERHTHAIQTWHTRMFYIRHQLTKIGIPLNESRKIFSRILKESLDILVERYTNAEPSYKRMPMVQKDILTILIYVSDHLLAASSNFGDYLDCFEPNIFKAIHANCSSLLAIMILLSSPLKNVYRIFKKGYSKKRKIVSMDEESSLKTYVSYWLSIIRPNLIPMGSTSLFQLQTCPVIYLQVEILTSQMDTSLSLLLTALTLKRYTLSILLLKNLTDERYFTSLLYLLVHTFSDSLQSCLLPIIESVGEWSVFDGHSTPTIWLNSIVALIEPLFLRSCRIAKEHLQKTKPVSIFAEKSLPCGCQPLIFEDHNEYSLFYEALQLLLLACVDLSSSLPKSLANFLATANSKASKIAPRNSVFILIFAASLRNVLSRQESTTLAHSIFSLLVFEKPSNKIASSFANNNKTFINDCIHKIIKNTDHISNHEMDNEIIVDSLSQEENYLTFTPIADGVLQKKRGVIAFRDIYQLIVTNKSWIGSELEISPFLNFKPNNNNIEFAMPVDQIDEPFNPIYSSTHVHGYKYQNSIIDDYHLDWDRLIQNDLGLSEANMQFLLSKRLEFREKEGLKEDEIKFVTVLKQYFNMS